MIRAEIRFHSSKSNFGPRVAVTWSPNPTGTGFLVAERPFCAAALASTTVRDRPKIKFSRLSPTASRQP